MHKIPFTLRSALAALVLAVSLAALAPADEAHAQSGADKARVEAKMERVQRLAPQWLASGGDRRKIADAQRDVQRAMSRGDFRALEGALDRILSVVEGVSAAPASGAAATRGGGGSRINLNVYDANGRAVPREELEATFFDFAVTTGVFPLDTDYQPVPSGVRSVEDGTVTLTPNLPDRVIFHFFLNVEGFGKVKVYADDGGEGYSVSELSSVVDLPLEGARSRIAKTRELMGRYPASAFGAETRGRIESAEAHLADAESDTASRERNVYRALADALWAGEMATVDAATYDIRRRGTRSDFLVGVAMPSRELGRARSVEQYIKSNLDLVTVPEFFLGGYEKRKGRTNSGGAERVVDWALAQNLKVKGHPLVYLIEPNTPRWLKGADFPRLRNAMYERIDREVRHFKGRITYWDVVNELNNVQLTDDQVVELTNGSCRAMEDADPSAVSTVNVNLPLGDHLAAPRVARMARAGKIRSAHTYFEQLRAASTPCEVLGLQWYYWGLDIMEASRLIDRFLEFGMPIHLTEVAVAAADGVDSRSRYFQDDKAVRKLGAWHGTWTEEAQADYLKQLLTVAYSKPDVKAFVWWDITDDFWPYGGLVDKGGKPRAAYHRLESVLESRWK